MKRLRYGFFRSLVLAAAIIGTASLVQAQSPLPATPLVQVIPHITMGAGFVTKFSIVNQSSSTNAIVFNDIREDGTLINSTNANIAPNGTFRMATPESNRFTASESHWALVGSQFPVGINLFFEFIQPPGGGPIVNTVGFNDVPPKTSFTMPVEFEPGPPSGGIGRTLGLAVANVSNATNSITIKLFNSNAILLATVTKSLPAFGKVAIDLTTEPSFQSALPNSNFVGSITITSSGPSSVIGVGDDFGPFFSVPPLNPPTTPSQALTVTIAPGDPDGGVISSGDCITRGVPAPGVTTAATMVISPAGDPIANGLKPLTWAAYVDTNGHVTAEFCHFGQPSIFPTAPQVFNIRVLSSTQASASAVFTVGTGTAVLAGDCITRGLALSGARTNKVVQVSPAGDPGAAGFGQQMLWAGYADAADHVTLELCHFGGGKGTFATATAPLPFNVSVID
jgi:hypothetical protein